MVVFYIKMLLRFSLIPPLDTGTGFGNWKKYGPDAVVFQDSSTNFVEDFSLLRYIIYNNYFKLTMWSSSFHLSYYVLVHRDYRTHRFTGSYRNAPVFL